MLNEVAELLESSSLGNPYKGAKEHFILDVDNKELVNKVVTILEEITPLSKPRKKK